MMHMLDLVLIRTFVMVADRSSMTAAANALNLTQGAVSQHVRRLEDQLGSALFERSRGGLLLTSLGERLLGRARSMLALNDEIWREIVGTTIRGRLRLGVPADLIGTSVAPALKAFAENHPQVELSLVCASSSDLTAAIGSGELDLAVIEERRGSETGETLAVDRLVWVGAKGGRACRQRPLPVSMVERVCVFRSVVFEALEKSGLPWRSSFETGSNEATLTAVRADMAVSAWLVSTVPSDLIILTDAGLPELASFSITLHFSGQTVSPATIEMARAIRENCFRYRLAC